MTTLRLSVFGILLVLSLSANCSVPAIECPINATEYANGLSKKLGDIANFCRDRCSNAINTVGSYCPLSKEQLVALTLLGLFVTTSEGQETTALSQCMSMLNSTIEQLGVCMNTTAILNQIQNNTAPTPGVDNLKAYVFTVFGAYISLGGIIVTPVCDSITIACAWLFHIKNAKRIKELTVALGMGDELTMLRRNVNDLSTMISVIIGILPNGIDQDQAKAMISNSFAAENEDKLEQSFEELHNYLMVILGRLHNGIDEKQAKKMIGGFLAATDDRAEKALKIVGLALDLKAVVSDEDNFEMTSL